MKKFEVVYFNNCAQEDQRFCVIARDEDHAKELFLKARGTFYDEESIEHIYDYYVPDFYTEEEIDKKLASDNPDFGW